MPLTVTNDTFHPAARPFVTKDHVAERDAWVALARGRNRRAVIYRRWAAESEAAGRLADYRHYRAAAEHCREGALSALSHARLEALYVL